MAGTKKGAPKTVAKAKQAAKPDKAGKAAKAVKAVKAGESARTGKSAKAAKPTPVELAPVSRGARSASGSAPVVEHDHEALLDGCDVAIVDLTGDEDLPAARGGIEGRH